MGNINESGVMKSEVVKEIFKWADKRCKKQKEMLKIAEKRAEHERKHCYFEDNVCFIEESNVDMAIAKAKLEAYVDIKVGLEKYMRKCRHEERESKISN